MSSTTRKAVLRRRRPARPSAARLRRLLRQPESLQTVVASLSSELDLVPLLERVLRHACELLATDNGLIGLVDSTGDLIRVVVTQGIPADAPTEATRGVGLIGEVLRTGAPVICRSYDDGRPILETVVGEDAAMGVPIMWREEVVGVLAVGTVARRSRGRGAHSGVRPLGTDDADVLTLLASHSAGAIVNARRLQQERQRSERFALVARVARLVSTDLRLDDLLRRAADVIHEILGFPNIAIALIEPDDPGTLVIRTFGGHYKAIIEGHHRMPITAGLMGAAARSREVVLVNDVANDPRYVPPPGTEGILAELAIPILRGDRALGVLNIESTAALTDADAAILGVIADQLAVAIENARLFAAAQQVAVLEERQRLSRDLHDAVTQHLASVALMAQTLSPAYHRDLVEGDRRAQRLLELSQAALLEMRHLLDELRPPRPDASDGPNVGSAASRKSALAVVRRHGLAGALRRLAADLSRNGLPVDVDVRGYAPQAAACEEALFRIAQEALANSAKHARATRAHVRLDVRDADTVLVVADDGVGFVDSLQAVRPTGLSGGLGLATMRERAVAIGGALHIDSSRTAGTTVEVVVPPVRA